jgi:hypothetical protein
MEQMERLAQLGRKVSRVTPELQALTELYRLLLPELALQ